jgi:3-oxoacyl-[acyl-carrier-protein] synthase-3
MSMRCLIRGVGKCLPEQVVTNDELSRTLDTSHDWIESRTGICQRHKASETEYTSTLCLHASRKALISAHIDPQDIDLIILATSTPDHTFPPTATHVQRELGAKRAIAFDMNVACSGFLFALTMADAFLKQAGKKNALVIGGETLTRLVDWQDRSTAVLFGDGAGAVVLSAHSSTRGIIDYELYTDGAGYDSLGVSGGPSSTQKAGTIHMNGREVFRQAVTQLEQASRTLLDKQGLTPSDVDWVVPHQANKRILDALSDRLAIPSSKMIYTGNLHANTSSASIPLALEHAYSEGMIKEGDLLLLQAFGAGFTWGACLIRA